MEWLSEPNAWIGLLTLTALEIVLGIDNIIFISILAGKLPREQQAKARRLGLMGAFVSRLALLFSIAWIVRLTAPLFTVLGAEVSGRDLILILGGLFLIAKATFEIHGKLEGEEHHSDTKKVVTSMGAVIAQIMVIDIVFSLDSVITAVGMVDQIEVMVAAVVTSVGVMLFAAKPIGEFVDRHPSVKVLALAFLVMVGMALTAEAFEVHMPKGYIYAAMAFSLGIKLDDIRHGLRTFDTTFFQAPGRMNVFDEHPFKVIFDYGHNAHAVGVMADLAQRLDVPGRRIVVLAGPGDRRDEDLRELGRAASGLDYVIAKEHPKYLRGRPAGSVARLIGEGLEEGGLPPERWETVLSEPDAVARALEMMADGDLVLIVADDTAAVLAQLQPHVVGE